MTTLFKSTHVLMLSILLAFSANVWSMNLSAAMGQLGAAKTQGLVGEQPNGYLGVIKNKNNAKEVVKLINQARKEQYQKLAQNHNVPLSKIEVLAGKKAIQKTPSGLYIQLGGKWIKKP